MFTPGEGKIMGVGGKGRPSKPTALKILDGTRSDRVNYSEPLPSEGAVRPTRPLDSVAGEVWRRLAPDLIDKGVLTAWDVDQFTVFCETVSVYAEAREGLAADGLVAKGAAGGVIKSPYWQIIRDAQGIMASLGGRFGLTPADRSSLSIGGEDAGEKGADLLTG